MNIREKITAWEPGAVWSEAGDGMFTVPVEKFHALLNPQSRYTPEEGRLNTELRIFALIRLGVSDVNQIADFLRCSPQTIYNYKSKIKKAALNGGDNFEETVRKLGSLSLDAFPSCLPADNA